MQGRTLPGQQLKRVGANPRITETSLDRGEDLDQTPVIPAGAHFMGDGESRPRVRQEEDSGVSQQVQELWYSIALGSAMGSVGGSSGRWRGGKLVCNQLRSHFGFGCSTGNLDEGLE